MEICGCHSVIAVENPPHSSFEKEEVLRKKWPDYERAVADMIDRTSSDIAPWNVIASNDKPWARVETLKRLVETIESAL